MFQPVLKKQVKDKKVAQSESFVGKAILFLIFNRPNMTAKVFERIQLAMPSRLYVASDGPRSVREGELERVIEARAIATGVDWPCEVETFFRDENLGCKRAVSEALDWFFGEEEEGIILEDDCVPDPSFFQFCEEMLERYREEENVATISGNNFVSRGPKDANRYFFSKYFHCWGWATWRRGWQLYRGNLEGWPRWHASKEFRKCLPDREEQAHWSRIFHRVHAGEIGSWAYPFQGSLWMAGKISIQPGVNLVENIGFGEDATHTRGSSNCPAQDSVKMPVSCRRRKTTKSRDLMVFKKHYQRKKRLTGKDRARKIVNAFPGFVRVSLYFLLSRKYRGEIRAKGNLR